MFHYLFYIFSFSIVCLSAYAESPFVVSPTEILPSDTIVSFINDYQRMDISRHGDTYLRKQKLEKAGHDINRFAINILADADYVDFWDLGINLFYYANYEDKKVATKKMIDFLSSNPKAESNELQKAIISSTLVLNDILNDPNLLTLNKVAKEDLDELAAYIITNNLLDKKVWIKKFGLEHIQYNKAELSIAVPRENKEEKDKAVRQYKKVIPAENAVTNLMTTLMDTYHITENSEILDYVEHVIKNTDYTVLAGMYEFNTSKFYLDLYQKGTLMMKVK